jgi:putative PIN family toxin of toxin-antitoxin system
MPGSRRFVFDANTVVSALLLPNSVPRQALDKARRAGHLLLSDGTVAELDDVLRRPHLNRYIAEEDRLLFLVALVHEAVAVGVTETVAECRDPKDDKYLELAVSGNAQCIISGDEDLLVLNPFRGIPVLTPRQFLDTEL